MESHERHLAYCTEGDATHIFFTSQSPPNVKSAFRGTSESLDFVVIDALTQDCFGSIEVDHHVAILPLFPPNTVAARPP